KELLTTLLESGILIPDGLVASLVGHQPHQVRFFHDSMQTYLTARGLFARSDWSCFVRAAGLPAFCAAPGRDRRAMSELFMMCVGIFRPLDRLRDCLKQTSFDWSLTRAQDLTWRDVLLATPPRLRSALEREAVGADPG